MKQKIAPFGDGLVCLRLIEKKDLGSVLYWRNRDDIRVWFKSNSNITLEQHCLWYSRYLEKNDDYLFVVEVGGVLVGQVSVYGIDLGKGVAEVGRFISSPDYAGRGYMRRACEELLKFCDNYLGLSYVFLEVFENNYRAIRLYKHIGFVEEFCSEGFLHMGRHLLSS